jgi:hypothetical protein
MPSFFVQRMPEPRRGRSIAHDLSGVVEVHGFAGGVAGRVPRSAFLLWSETRAGQARRCSDDLSDSLILVALLESFQATSEGSRSVAPLEGCWIPSGPLEVPTTSRVVHVEASRRWREGAQILHSVAAHRGRRARPSPCSGADDLSPLLIAAAALPCRPAACKNLTCPLLDRDRRCSAADVSGATRCRRVHPPKLIPSLEGLAR